MNELREIIKLNKETCDSSFYYALYIYLKKPQVVNRKLSCSKNISLVRLDNKYNFENICEIIKNSLKTSEPLERIKDNLNRDGIKYTFEHLDNLKRLEACCQLVSVDKITSKNNVSCFQIVWIDTIDKRVSFYPIGNSSKILPLINYAVQFKDLSLNLFVSKDDFDNNACNWLRYVLLKKFQNWMESKNNNDDDDDDDDGRIESHSLIDKEEYSQLYIELKGKYGKIIESIWTDEVTDPKKFIYEDIAICTYILIFWKRERKENKSNKKQTFLDFGCGNGLLVYLLTQEGHKGYGIDLRKRKIWSKFVPQVDLRESTWTPNDYFNDIDWIIGNHSDELSPWVPVVAYKSSITCKYFLLPCCAYEFSGTKFQRRNTFKSAYMDFIDYLKEISLACGFKSTLIDRLKIPSTKRICLIGLNRSDQIENFQEQCEAINNFIKTSNEQKNQEFVPRDKVQVVRNCTKIDRNLKERIIKIVFEELLKEENFCKDYGEWNCGRELLVSNAVKLISTDDLKMLKSECGGLQTLLKNKNQIFEIRDGIIRIRKPKSIADTKITSKAQKKNVLKTSPCYFNLYHKQGCFLTSEECCFKH